MTDVLADEAATEAAGAALAERLAPGDLVILVGPLAAGKTTFVRGAALALGARGPVQSPTFVVGRTYEPAAEDAPAIHHLDLYRFAGELDPDDQAALEPYFEADAVTFVEWPQAGEGSFPVPPRVTVRLDHDRAGGGRTLSLDWHDDAGV